MKLNILKPVLFSLLLTIISVSFSHGQSVVSKQAADSLIRSLTVEKADTNMIRNLLTLAYYEMAHVDYTAAKDKRLYKTLGFIRQAEVLSEKLHATAYLYIAYRYYARCDFLSGAFEESRRKSFKVIEYYRRTGNVYQEASTWSEMGDNVYYDDSVRAPVRLYGYQCAYQLFKKGHYRLEAIAAYKNMADVHLNQGKLDLAEKELLQVLTQYRQIGYKTLHYTYDLLAAVYRAKNDQKNELNYQLLMLQTMDSTGSLQDRAGLIFGVIVLYNNLGQHDKALYWSNEAIALYKQSEHDDFYYQAVCAAARACINTRKFSQALTLLTGAQHEKEKSPFAVNFIDMCFGEYHMALRHYDQAEIYFLNVHQFFQKTDARYYLKPWAGLINVALANINIQRRNFIEARKYLALAELSPKIKNHLFKSNFELAFSKVDSADGNFASALSHFKKYKKISDSLYNVTKSGQMAQLEVQYETKQKEQSIKLLNSEARFQKARLDKVNLQRNIILAALILFAIIGVITYRFYRYKQKSNESILESYKLVESKNKQLELLVEEKEWLLKEVHHRVKNNLHTIICLLESQSAFLENDALEAMENSQNRIYTMSLIHQKLYQSDDIQTIDMSIYIPELLQYLKDSFGTSSDQIYFHINIARVSLPQTIAIPLALIINEAVTNSIKYAFPGNTGGKIMISLQEENGSIKLELADNGVGMTNSVQDTEPLSLGLQLIRGLSKEIQGDLKIKSKGGVRITITFKKYPWDNHVHQAEL